MTPLPTAREDAQQALYAHRLSHINDIAMLLGHNGRCRNSMQFEKLANRAGLRLRKIWGCRGPSGLLEFVLPQSNLGDPVAA